MVRISLFFEDLFLIMLWCDQVTLTPLLSRMIVFSRGIPSGLISVRPMGDQLFPNSSVGTKALSKKAQKIEKRI
jgi:hypothetical protein